MHIYIYIYIYSVRFGRFGSVSYSFLAAKAPRHHPTVVCFCSRLRMVWLPLFSAPSLDQRSHRWNGNPRPQPQKLSKLVFTILDFS